MPGIFKIMITMFVVASSVGASFTYKIASLLSPLLTQTRHHEDYTLPHCRFKHLTRSYWSTSDQHSGIAAG
jgi:hypothetical protein